MPKLNATIEYDPWDNCYWVITNDGWQIADDPENHMARCETKSDAKKTAKSVVKCNCKYCRGIVSGN